ncbi:hypothetical protein AD998_10540 [bacterium 336/3]|nr:hypothetical protein AD998_10540 [bacterium 336/3]
MYLFFSFAINHINIQDFMAKEVWLHIHYTENIKNKVRAREILPERFVLLEGSLISLEYDLIPKGTIMYAKSIDNENYITHNNYLDILEESKEYTYVYEILTSTIPYIFDFEKMIVPALKKHHFSYEIKSNKYLLIHILEEDYPTINSIFEKLNYAPKEIDMYDFGAKKYEVSKSVVWEKVKEIISTYGKWIFLPSFSFIFIGRFIRSANIQFSLDKLLQILWDSFTFGAVFSLGFFLFIEWGLWSQEAFFEKRYISPAYLAKMKQLKTFVNKHKFLFFRDRWKGYFEGFLVEIKISYDYVYQIDYYVQAPVTKDLYYNLEKLRKDYHHYHELNYVCVYTNVSLGISYPKVKEMETHLSEMITQIQNIQVKHY